MASGGEIVQIFIVFLILQNVLIQRAARGICNEERSDANMEKELFKRRLDATSSLWCSVIIKNTIYAELDGQDKHLVTIWDELRFEREF